MAALSEEELRQLAEEQKDNGGESPNAEPHGDLSLDEKKGYETDRSSDQGGESAPKGLYI